MKLQRERLMKGEDGNVGKDPVAKGHFATISDWICNCQCLSQILFCYVIPAYVCLLRTLLSLKFMLSLPLLCMFCFMTVSKVHIMPTHFKSFACELLLYIGRYFVYWWLVCGRLNLLCFMAKRHLMPQWSFWSSIFELFVLWGILCLNNYFDHWFLRGSSFKIFL